VFDGHQQPIRFHQFVEDILQNVFGVARIGHTPTNEVKQAGLLPHDHFGDSVVLFECHPFQASRTLHLQV
jgi:hypothetical protein